MSNLTVVPSSTDLIQFDQAKRELIKKTISKDLTDMEFALFMSVAGARGLDPVLGQIHGVKRDGKLVMQVSIDGGRLVAARTNEYAGSDEPTFKYDKDAKTPISARVKVWRFVQGQRVSFVGVAYWDEFYPGDKLGFMWKKMPRTMLAKCAEMQALRKGFPNETGGLYAEEELQREVAQESASTESSQSLLDRPDEQLEKDRIEITAKFRKLGVTADMICDKFDISDIGDLTREHIKELNKIGQALTSKTDKKTVADFFGVTA